MRVPDIKNGSIINGSESRNQWKTFIESCLVKNTERAWLCSSCRIEHVSPDRIFADRSAEACVARTWKGSFMIRNGSGLNHPWRRKISKLQHFSPSVEGEVFVEEVDVKPLGFDHVLADLKSGGDNFLYMSVHWGSYTVIAPCRYTNFGNEYIQPISGPVLVEDGERFYTAYIACHVTREATHIEICKRQSVPIWRTKKGVCGPLSYALIKWLPLPLVDEFIDAFAVDGECVFFRYD